MVRMTEQYSEKALTQAKDHARNIAMSKIAKKAQTDLYYLNKYILDYDAMTDRTHGELCQLTTTLLPAALSSKMPPKTL